MRHLKHEEMTKLMCNREIQREVALEHKIDPNTKTSSTAFKFVNGDMHKLLMFEGPVFTCISYLFMCINVCMHVDSY